MRKVILGPMLGESYVITDGLTEGEEIVTSGTFSVDAAAQLEGKPSMMNPSNEKPSAISGMVLSEITFGVSGNCDMCKERIEKAALSVNGAKTASWDAIQKKVKIEYNSEEASPEDFHRAISKVGHDTDLMKADDEVYKALPECCLYRK